MRAALTALLLASIATGAAAQYRWVDRSGQVGYGDQPPPGAHDVERVGALRPSDGRAADPLRGLPFELRRAAERFPTVLYVTKSCAPCDAGRELLRSRSIPFTELTISTVPDVEALRRLTGADRLPVLTVGRQMINEFNAAQWQDALDAAGYPRESILPPDWRWPEPRPLTEPPAPRVAAPEAAPAATPGSQP
jgi:glutaredoxin